MNILTKSALVLAALSGFAAPAEAKRICGWDAIAACTHSFADANAFMSRGWGFVINTNDFAGLKPGYFCVGSGPQSKAGAARDRRVATANGVAKGIYIKRACVDDSRFGE
jgi:hypothetical protein